MKLLFDMNLSPILVDMMNNCGWESIHWSSVVVCVPVIHDNELSPGDE
jgi:predicted nuclease of predicted toxin-antitoxin system